MGLTRRDAGRALGVVTLLAFPFLSAEYYFRREAPGQEPGVYLETDHGYAATLVDAERALHTITGYVINQPGAARDALQSPTPAIDRQLSFFVVGPKASAFLRAARTAKLWCVAVDGTNDHFRDDAVEVPTTMTEINPGAYRFSSPELLPGWYPQRIAFQQYQRALSRVAGPRHAIEVLIGLELTDPASGARRMYSVRVGPPR